MVNTTNGTKWNQNKSLFLKQDSKLDSYVLRKQIKEYKLGTAIGAIITRRVA